MGTTRWSIIVPEETDKALRTYLSGIGLKKGDISKFVDEAVQLRLFDLVAEQIKERNQKFDQSDILGLIDEAVASR